MSATPTSARQDTMRLVHASPSRVPGIYCPLTRFESTTDSSMKTELLTWMTRFGLGDPATREVYVETAIGFANDCFPLADAPGWTTMSQWSLLGFIFDDSYVEDLCAADEPDEAGLRRFTAAANCIADILNRRQVQEDADGAVIQAMADFAATVARQYPPEVLAWIAEGWTEWISGLHWQLRLRGTVPSLAEFFAERPGNFATLVNLTVTAAGSGLDLGEPSWRSPAAQAMILSAHALPLIHNEWASYDKEHKAGTDNINLVKVVAHEYGITVDDAIGETARLHDSIMAVFLKLAEKCEVQSPYLARWPDTLRNMAIGSLHFCSRVSRYNWPPDRRLVLNDHLSPDAPGTPIPEPIEWWWHEAGLHLDEHSDPAALGLGPATPGRKVWLPRRER